MNADHNPPAGFLPLTRSSPVLDLLGPLFVRGKGREMVLGFRVQAKHGNARGILHGGFVATLADVAMGYAIAFASEPPTPLLTANLTVDFAGAAAIGDWLEVRVDIQKRGARLAFANCYVSKGDERIARASAVFMVTEQGTERIGG